MRDWASIAADLPGYLASHVQLTLLAMLIGLALSLPLGVLASRRPRLAAIVLGGASVLQTIPGLALMALMVPLLGALGAMLEAGGLGSLPNIGFLPAVLALSLYSVLPMLRNTLTGILGVDPSLVEAARGVGMSAGEVLWQVELPLAMPTVVAGIRTATVWVVGMATLATPVGGTSLGNPIFAGLQTRNLSAVLAGSLAAAGLALVLDGLIRGVKAGLERRAPGRIRASLAGIGIILLLTLIPRSGPSMGSDVLEVTIGAKTFTEQYVLAEILAGIVRETPGVAVRPVPSLGSTVAFDALASGDLDLYVDYSGTVWATILGRASAGESRASVLDEVRTRLREDFDIEVLGALGFENTYALAMRRADAEAGGIERISDLAAVAGRLEILGDFEFFGRPEWRAIESRYGLAFGRERAMDSSLMYEALNAGSGDVVSAYSTDGRIEAYDLALLEDDRGVIPPYDAILLASGRFVRAHEDLADRLRALAGRIDGPSMRRLNAGVDLEGRAPEEVAREWLAACWEDGGKAHLAADACGGP